MEKLTYLIIGASKLGTFIASKLVENGSRVVIVYDDERSAAELYGILDENYLLYQYNLNDIYNIENIFFYLNRMQIVCSGMVYCAETNPVCSIEKNTFDVAEKVFRKNVFSMIECAKFFQKDMYSYEGSKIVVISSVVAHLGGNSQSIYGASKAALISAIRLMAKELLERNIKINSFSLGITEIGKINEIYQKINIEGEKSTQLIGDELFKRAAEMICVYLSSLTDFLTGTDIIYDAGLLLS